MPAAIHVENLNFSFGEGELKRQVLNAVNLTLLQGEIVILTGPSGSGKTTLLTLIGALRVAQEGSISIFGRELVKAREAELNAVRLHTGYIFQQHNLLAGLTAQQNVEMALELRPELSSAARKNAARQILEQVGLGDRRNYKPAQLSGGQKQRVSIARALVAKPHMVLADEPTASLDKASGMEAVEILKTLAREQGSTILLVTHDYRILDIADRVVELEDGQIRAHAFGAGQEQDTIAP